MKAAALGLVLLLSCAVCAQEPEVGRPWKTVVYAGATFAGSFRGHYFDTVEETTQTTPDLSGAIAPALGVEVARPVGAFEIGAVGEFARFAFSGSRRTDELWNFMALARYRLASAWLAAAAGLHLASSGTYAISDGGNQYVYDSPATAIVISPRLGYDFDRLGVHLSFTTISSTLDAFAPAAGAIEHVYTRSFWTLAARFSL